MTQKLTKILLPGLALLAGGMLLAGSASPAAAHNAPRKRVVVHRHTPNCTCHDSPYRRTFYRRPAGWAWGHTYRPYRYDRSPWAFRRDPDRDGVRNKFDHDMDGDGVRNRFDRDRDGDGVRNRHDDHDRNPRRR